MTTIAIGPIRRPRCAGPGCKRTDDAVVLVRTRLGLVPLCRRCKELRDQVIRDYFDRRTAQAAQARFWAERGVGNRRTV